MKHGTMEAEIKQTALQGRLMTVSLGKIMKEKNVTIKKKEQDKIVLQTLTYRSEMWTLNEADRSISCC